MLRRESWCRDHDPFLDQCSPCLSKGVGVCQDMLVGRCKELGAEDLSMNRLGKIIQRLEWYGTYLTKIHTAFSRVSQVVFCELMLGCCGRATCCFICIYIYL